MLIDAHTTRKSAGDMDEYWRMDGAGNDVEIMYYEVRTEFDNNLYDRPKIG